MVYVISNTVLHVFMLHNVRYKDIFVNEITFVFN